MEVQQARDLAKDAYHLVLLIVMVLVLLGVVSWVFGCSVIPLPKWCDAYWFVMGSPKVLIVHGSEGLGDPDLLRLSLSDPEHLGVRAQTQDLGRISLGNLKQYQLVIVEKAKKISTDKLKVFMDYVDQGGRLVWTGDAGTELDAGDEFLYKDELEEGKPHEIISPWMRKKDGKVVGFGDFLGVEFLGNFCDGKIKDCSEPFPAIGVIDVPNTDHELVQAARQGLLLFGNMAITEAVEDAPSTIVASIDYRGSLITNDGRDLGRSFPLIITNGLGEKVAYYAIPPEQFVSDGLAEKLQTMNLCGSQNASQPDKGCYYWNFLEKMYSGMIK
ncbi:MAG: hypothetical protein V1494_02695 [Candidatus Diapherotrites archaeon]